MLVSELLNVASRITGVSYQDGYSYYIYNNQYYVPIEVDKEDSVERDEYKLHICPVDLDPRNYTDNIFLIRNLFLIAGATAGA
jgi:hypothetical protein